MSLALKTLIQSRVQARQYRLSSHAQSEREAEMTICYFCKGKVTAGHVQHIHRWGDQVFMLENVPAEICQQCGEVYFAPDVLARMDKIALSKTKPKMTIQVPVYSFA